MKSSLYDLIIIGAGPAGLTAALYAGRFRLNTLVLEKLACGGQIILAPTIENFPGFPGSTSTQELMDRMNQQVKDLGIEIKTEEVLELSKNNESQSLIYSLRTQEATYQTKTIIVATGAEPKRLNVAGEERLIGRGVSYCGTCDGPLFKHKDILMIGGGDRAIEEAIFLSGYATSVTIIHRRQALRASKILEEKAKQNSKIRFILDSVVEEIIGQNKVEAVRLKDVKTNALNQLPCEGVFIFVGISPHTALLKNQLQLDEAGFIITDEQMRTSQEAIFACGDCRKKALYQVINACAEGAVAAYSAERYLI